MNISLVAALGMIVVCATSVWAADSDQEITDAYKACEKYHVPRTIITSAQPEWREGHEHCAVVRQKYEAAEIGRKAREAADDALIAKVGEKK